MMVMVKHGGGKAVIYGFADLGFARFIDGWWEGGIEGGRQRRHTHTHTHLSPAERDKHTKPCTMRQVPPSSARQSTHIHTYTHTYACTNIKREIEPYTMRRVPPDFRIYELDILSISEFSFFIHVANVYTLLEIYIFIYICRLKSNE